MADARGEYWYLDDGVEPNKITVPELRSILLKHGVNYPSSAKKPQLIELFTVNVLPQAAKLQRAAARTVRSSRGIVDVPSSSASTTTTDDTGDDTLVPPPSVRKSSRRTTRATTAEQEEDKQAYTPAPRRAKTPLRTVPNKHGREPDADVDGQPAHSRQRQNLKEPSPDPEAWNRPGADSPFTHENPFQKSSPQNAEAHARERRRKTMGFENKERRKSDANRRRTVQPQSSQQDDGFVVPSRKTFEMPVARVKKQEKAVVAVPDSEDEGEEYTPEEQLELVRERAKNGEVDILPPRRRRDSRKTANTVQAFLLTFFATILAVLGGVWREEKFAIGFCNTGSVVPTAIAGVEIPEFATGLLPQCEPCPPHAYCYPRLQVECEKDFIKKYHPLSFGGVLPLPPTCEPDTEKTQKVTQIANHAVQNLRKRRAQYECGEEDAQGNVVQSPEISVADLKQSLLAKKGKSLSNEEFEDLFAKAVGEIPARQEIVETSDGTTGERRLASTSLAELTLSCSIRRSVRESVERHLLQIVGLVLFLASGAYGRYAIMAHRATEARAKQLASDVFDRLANQAALAHQEPGAYQDRGLSMNQLRDDVLRTEFSSSRRINLWKRVQKKVEHNSNIRAAVREGASGDVTRMWEWIGPVRLLEDGRSNGKRDGGRRSIGYISTPGSSPPEPKEMKELQKWDDGHPQY
ncbi:sister chromatid separation protein-like protein [Bimuria novae-zelandiae CBS 107.79]|uniref:Sister chromatid separation protein-like protein n=1 Tax=Bimuria novae-zelandiae CBS 107.79 TaxID=1447943 RepID=A0A6A5VQD8_9PLEO|nr:sister chromatid separation protein-like protein [Bimuria novae-zelandiae CBS 107.79]